MNDELEVLQLDRGLWMIHDGICRCYLAVGEEKALLFDTGIGKGNIKEAVAGITEKPVTLVISHTHVDHLGGVRYFPELWMSEKEADRIPEKPLIHYVSEGDRFDLGGAALEVVETPGHSIGSIALLNRKQRYLLSADTFEDDQVLLHTDTGDVRQYQQTLQKLLTLRDEFDLIYPSHLTYPLRIGTVERMLEAVSEYLTGKYEPEPYTLVIPGKVVECRRFEYKGMSFTLRSE